MSMKYIFPFMAHLAENGLTRKEAHTDSFIK